MQNTKVIFDRTKLIKNLKSLNTLNVCAMVKANAYGLGVKNVCTTLLGKVKYFGVANMSEALAIREFDKITPVLIVGICSDFNSAISNNIELTIESLEMLLRLESYIQKQNNKIKIHIKINTGMNRLGIDEIIDFKKCLKIIQNNRNIVLQGVFTHFATIENDNIFLKNRYVRDHEHRPDGHGERLHSRHAHARLAFARGFAVHARHLLYADQLSAHAKKGFQS